MSGQLAETTKPPPTTAAAEIEQLIGKGDLAALTPQQRTSYYLKVCDSLGLNHLTQPFEFSTLGKKLVLYARKGCTDQLRKLHGIKVEIVSKVHDGDLYTVTARAVMPDGRTDEDDGVVNLKGLGGELLANAYMKAITKAKRRVTLSICGLGFLDESEMPEPPAASQKTHADLLTQPAASPATPPAAETNGANVPAYVAAAAGDPVNDQQLGRLRILRDRLFAFKNVTNEQQKKDIWSKILAKRGVTSATQLTFAQADELLNAIAGQVPAATEGRDRFS